MRRHRDVSVGDAALSAVLALRVLPLLGAAGWSCGFGVVPGSLLQQQCCLLAFGALPPCHSQSGACKPLCFWGMHWGFMGHAQGGG